MNRTGKCSFFIFFSRAVSINALFAIHYIQPVPVHFFNRALNGLIMEVEALRNEAG